MSCQPLLAAQNQMLIEIMHQFYHTGPFSLCSANFLVHRNWPCFHATLYQESDFWNPCRVYFIHLFIFTSNKILQDTIVDILKFNKK